MAPRELPDVETVRKLLDYNPATGAFRWLPRTPDMFRNGGHSAEHNCGKWNALYAGNHAGVCVNGYLSIRICCRRYQAHRVAWLLMTGGWPDDEIDHINLDRSDNRFENLRAATRAQNEANKRITDRNTSGLKGVTWDKRKEKWMAQIRKDGRTIFLGYFDVRETAHIAYCSAAKRLFCEFARVS